MHRDRIGRGAAALLLALSASACMAIDTQTNKSYRGPQVYSGTRYDLGNAGDAFIDLNIGWLMFLLGDLPFSFLADTVMLPYTIPKESARSKEHAEEVQVASERPSPVQPRPGEAPQATAERLFTACEKLVVVHDRHLVDCYSIDAQIRISGGEPIRGADYKPMLREHLARSEAAYESVDWRDPQYQVEGERVRITAVRGSSASKVRAPIVLLVGPCPDGSWRILEEDSVGWPEPK